MVIAGVPAAKPRTRTNNRDGGPAQQQSQPGDGRVPSCVDRCPTACPTTDHVRVTPAPERESDDLAIAADR
jgi:hypothetical protein